MDSVYANSRVILSTVASGEYKGSQYKGNSTKVQEREVISPKWTKVLLTLLGFSLVFALGGLCALWMLYNHNLADFESLNEQHIMVSKQLEAQEINSTALKKQFNDLTARYNTLREWLSFSDAQSCNLSVDGWIACRGKLYLFNADKLNWSSSRDVCVSKGADLVTITSRSEQDFLVFKIKVTHWIGLNDLDTEGHWVWVNNQTLKDTGVQFWFNEEPRQPDNWRVEDPSGENCASLGDHNGNFQSWFDASCKTKKKFICEKKYFNVSVSDQDHNATGEGNYKQQFDELHNQLEETLRNLNILNHSTGCALCSVHWIHFGGKCYYFSTVKMNWTQSRDHCVTLGGHLVIINSQAELDFLTSKVKVTHWIGLNDLDTEGHWFWVNNQPPNNSVEFWIKRENGVREPDNWTKGHPAGEDCASLGHPAGETDFWTDAFCFQEKRFVCEAAAVV
ncbi:C-type mannose receptor 2-like [Megalobrama amblycephala]|uniref:C-type mannose receptor 2-like n=1 Tax=Megalobrama amblycephala TaxID=75352 RepID=UPI002013F943|nr:C-type mannose receptor 2-like [Megalobrama amblycephala]